MLAHRLRRWSNITTALDQRLVSAGAVVLPTRSGDQDVTLAGWHTVSRSPASSPHAAIEDGSAPHVGTGGNAKLHTPDT